MKIKNFTVITTQGITVKLLDMGSLLLLLSVWWVEPTTLAFWTVGYLSLTIAMEYTTDVQYSAPPYRHVDGIPVYRLSHHVNGLVVGATKKEVFIHECVVESDALLAHEATHVKRHTAVGLYYYGHTANALTIVLTSVVLSYSRNGLLSVLCLVTMSVLASVSLYALMRREENIADRAAAQQDDVSLFINLLEQYPQRVTGWGKLVSTHPNTSDRINSMRSLL